MKIRTIYFKVHDMAKAVAFRENLLKVKPHKSFDEWHEFMVGDMRFALLLNDEDGDSDDTSAGNNCVPVFELPDADLQGYIITAIGLGGEIVFDGLNDPDVQSIVLADPFGNEFELSKFHE